MAAHYPIRPFSADEFDSVRAVVGHAFLGAPVSQEERDAALSRFELDRSLAAFDGDTPVGSAGIYSFPFSVPGAVLPTAGVTFVAVLPSHRRRGILSSLMRRQLSDIHDRGEPLAALWASEAQIYGRYGYGRASWHSVFTLQRGEGTLATDAPRDPALRVRITDPQAARAELAKVYDTLLPAQPGFFGRNTGWWDRTLHDPAEHRNGFSVLRCVLAEDDTGPRGYALYRGQNRWDGKTFLPDSILEIRELFATDPAATAALWADLVSRDLVSELTVRLRPVDDPLLYLLSDPRRARPAISDGVWIRLVDLPAALSQRRYACPVDVVIEVTDQACPWNTGRWRLAGSTVASDGPGVIAHCEQTTDPADVILPMSSLGAAYLGGTQLCTLARAGQAAETRPGALAALSAAMSWHIGPWCPVIF